MNDPNDDRRKYPRVHTDAVVSIARIEAPSSLGHAMDLSEGGIRFQCVGVELDLADVVRVTLTLGTDTIEIVGRLVRLVELDAFTQEVALAFLDVDAEADEVLKRHLTDDFYS